MRFSEFSTPNSAALTAFDEASSRATADDANVLFRANKADGGEIERYIRHDANTLMRRVLRSVWQDVIPSIDNML